MLWGLAIGLDSEEGYQEYRAIGAIPGGGGSGALGCILVSTDNKGVLFAVNCLSSVSLMVVLFL